MSKHQAGALSGTTASACGATAEASCVRADWRAAHPQENEL